MTDRDDVLDLVARSADAVNRLDAEQFESLWTPEAAWVIDPPLDFTLEGSRAEIAKGFEAGMRAMWASFLQLIHSTTVDVDGDTATARTYLTEQGIRPDGTGQLLHGVYEDTVVRTDEGWRFARRHFRYLYLDQPQLGGQAAATGTFALPVAP
ncbi:nuclear transport factor 2 family protein [Streptomyces sp. NPDC057253]|uniref:nuclear transport factor 2 family protein n=1 Tax=Streptomyces sp. NPDC057253 TaxID=3346069 RepID=UPI0036265F8A